MESKRLHIGLPTKKRRIMNKIFKYIGCLFFAGAALTACSSEEFSGADGNLVPVMADYEDNFSVTVDQATNTAYFTFTSAPGVSPYWIIDDGESVSGDFSFSKYWRKKGDHKVVCRVRNKHGVSDGSIEKTFSIEKTVMSGFGGFNVESEHNLFSNAVFTDHSFYFATDGWVDTDPPTVTMGEDGRSFTLSGVTCGPERWQGQFALNNMGIQVEAGKVYDFSCIATASNSITGQGMKIKICNQDGDSPVLMDKDFKINNADEPLCLYATELDGENIANMKIVFDFGGTPENTDIIFEDFVLIEHQYNDVDAPTELETPFNYDDANNVWKQFDESGDVTETSWFGDASWADMGVTLTAERDGSHYRIVIPATTVNEQWHAQYALHPSSLPVSADDTYDISVCVTTSKELPGMTLKITEDGGDDADNNYFMADRVGFKNEYVWKYEGVKLVNYNSGGKPRDASNIAIVMDFSGAEEGTEIDIYDITIIKK